MTLRYSLLGAIALGLCATGAFAQDASTDPNAAATDAATPPVNPPADPAAMPPATPAADTTGAPMQAPTGVPADVAATSTSTTTTMENGATLTHTVVTNGPVADTPENRARYGQPLSHAGRHTAARGN